MIKDLRQHYNTHFSEFAYQQMMDWITNHYQYTPTFHVGETPVFFTDDLRQKLTEASADVTKVITAPGFAQRAEKALLPGQTVPNRNEHPLFLQMDFGLCKGENGEITPQLIEAQGFPSLYHFQSILSNAYRKFMPVPEGYTSFFGGLDEAGYHQLLSDCILNGEQPENVILLEIEPQKQNTRIDFLASCDKLGIAEVCISELTLEGRKLFYLNNGVKTQVKRIYNRVIFDELLQRDDIKREFNMTEEVDVSWAGHPDWFFMLSKHTLPEFDSKYVPKSYFLSDLETYPDDLENFVLKPLYSFAGAGVILNPTPEDLASIEQPENYILQRKVVYANLIETLDDPARVEVRLMYVWPPNAPAPILVNNLVRLSKGEMIGVKYNKGKTWVGGSIGYFKPESDSK
jgi:hypothetical protein